MKLPHAEIRSQQRIKVTNEQTFSSCASGLEEGPFSVRDLKLREAGERKGRGRRGLPPTPPHTLQLCPAAPFPRCTEGRVPARPWPLLCWSPWPWPWPQLQGASPAPHPLTRSCTSRLPSLTPPETQQPEPPPEPPLPSPPGHGQGPHVPSERLAALRSPSLSSSPPRLPTAPSVTATVTDISRVPASGRGGRGVPHGA